MSKARQAGDAPLRDVAAQASAAADGLTVPRGRSALARKLRPGRRLQVARIDVDREVRIEATDPGPIDLRVGERLRIEVPWRHVMATKGQDACSVSLSARVDAARLPAARDAVQERRLGRSRHRGLLVQRLRFDRTGDHVIVLRVHAELEALHWRTGQVMLHDDAVQEVRLQVHVGPPLPKP